MTAPRKNRPNELLRAMFDVGYFPPNTPPPDECAGRNAMDMKHVPVSIGFN